MTYETINTQPIADQKPGTSGLRKKTRVFMQQGYLENFVQATLNAIDGAKGKRFVVGGDGRYFNVEAIQTILKLASANGAVEVIVGQDGLLSTPAASHLIRLNKTDGGFILSASHNPGGIDEDFGIKSNSSNGGPAPENLTDKMFAETTTISSYKIAHFDDVDLSQIGVTQLGDMTVRVIDPVQDYAALMEELFDFDAISAMFTGGFSMCFDAMHAITGPYAKKILEERLGAASGTVINATPLPDFGGGHPDPNPTGAKPLMDLMMSDAAPDFGAASDGDGDRNMIVGRGVYVTPSDSLAILAANAHLAPAYSGGLAGIARSMPTSAASDRVANKLGIEAFETPTGWKFFGNLLDAGRVTICGEESAGTGSDHVREKDGLWAVLLWLNILAQRKLSVIDILDDHWSQFGRDYYSRLDFEAVPSIQASALIADITAQLESLPGQSFGQLTVSAADMFGYKDPVDGSISSNQGLRIWFDSGARAVFRLSGTGTEGATIRLYLEQYRPVGTNFSAATADVLQPVKESVMELAKFKSKIGRTRPDVVT